MKFKKKIVIFLELLLCFENLVNEIISKSITARGLKLGQLLWEDE